MMRRTVTRLIVTLANLLRVKPWLWVCERCQHRSPAAIVPLMIRWGADASSDILQRSARLTRRGGKGVTIQLPGWGELKAPVLDWPAKNLANAKLGIQPDGPLRAVVHRETGSLETSLVSSLYA